MWIHHHPEWKYIPPRITAAEVPLYRRNGLALYLIQLTEDQIKHTWKLYYYNTELHTTELPTKSGWCLFTDTEGQAVVLQHWTEFPSEDEVESIVSLAKLLDG